MSGEGETEGFPSIDDVEPVEEGGPVARSGFNYQDDIAVGFLVEMLGNSSLVKVHCETHDDVVLVSADSVSQTQTAEFVQVKASQPDKLWSLPDVCAREKGKVGTSIVERSLARDRHKERAQFRIVTHRPVVTMLEPLTLDRDTAGRKALAARFEALRSGLEKRVGELKSAKGNGIAYWLENCLWDQRHSENAVCNSNLLAIIRQSSRDGKPLLPDLASVLIDELRAWVKKAGSAKWVEDPKRKMITRKALREWWDVRTTALLDGAKRAAGGRLADKMADAGLPDDMTRLAVDLRREYAAVVRSSGYMPPEEGEFLTRLVKSEIVSLRSRLVAGQLELDGPAFHDLCVNRLDKLNEDRPAQSEDRSAFLKGCMYDIADRCLLRFDSPAK